MGDDAQRSDRGRREQDEQPGAVAVAPAPTDEDGTGTPLATAMEKATNAGKLSKKERRLLKDAHRPLDSWEKYRALTDILDEQIELVDLADHKARFALVIMAALNVLLFFGATRTDIVEDLPGSSHIYLAGYLLIYVLVALYFFMQAVESLRPRKSQPQVDYHGDVGPQEHPLGIRFYEDILGRDLDAYRRVWRDLRIGQLNNELAVQAHALAGINHAKYRALRRLYMGLKIITLMAVGLVGLAALAAFVGTARAGPQGRKNSMVFGSPNRLATPGVQEPSGVAIHPGLGHLFVVGDEGSLVEFDGSGNSLRSHSARGNLEDVAAHDPTGWLGLLDEQRSEIVFYDPVAQRTMKRWKLDREGILGQRPGGANEGFEGLAFRPEAGRPGGGIFYLVHQRDPAMLVALTIDVTAHGATVGGSSVLGRWSFAGRGDVTAVTWSPALQRVLLVADKEDELLVLRDDGSIESALPLPGQQQEGVALDGAGNLWVADDQDKSLLKMDAALPSIEKYLKNPASFQDPLSQMQQTGASPSAR
jgi:uncharacterized protein YjiK/uncharacterized membrane protein YuzA (DUF378 family)